MPYLGVAPTARARTGHDAGCGDDMRPAPRPANGRRTFCVLSYALPRHAASVGVARRILDSVLQVLAVDQYCRAELLLALSEGCANASGARGGGRRV